MFKNIVYYDLKLGWVGRNNLSSRIFNLFFNLFSFFGVSIGFGVSWGFKLMYTMGSNDLNRLHITYDVSRLGSVISWRETTYQLILTYSGSWVSPTYQHI